ncbi:DUF2784 domain-containing protein [Pseudonocardia sp. C8]|uniref:DUF2784 domain-containing protein n=1 Tax=Pseudonocardia sp. C8 TaxID=2762759 RepID=UPI0016423CBD|nr:DUF2784 domain-containing protein [Pseudonocardia sp. C8]
MSHEVLAETAMVVHFAFLAYVAFGGFLAWRWPRTYWLHLLVSLYALGIVVIGWECPLTRVERRARALAGHPSISEAGFVDHYLTGTLYPAEHEPTVQLVLVALVLVSWAGVAVSARSSSPT